MKEYYCTVTLSYGGNNHEAKNKEEYIQKVKQGFFEEFGIKITEDEISDIEEENEDGKTNRT